jgi:hypothetical protein
MGLDFVSEIMNRVFPEVRWDRCVLDELAGCAYGWIDRPDARSDFVLLRWDMRGVGFTTSSAAMSREFSVRMNGHAEGHSDCERVEDVFGASVKNKIVLPVAGAA